ncbi:MAG: YicC/YloC family endoribonuclease, partial [Thermodesulfovibrionales bacterium]
ESGSFAVEIRSVNHRFLDVYFRMAPSLARHEPVLRKMVREVFSKGRLDISIQTNPETTSALKVNSGYVSALVEALREIKERHGIGGDITIDSVAGFRDVFVTESAEVDTAELTAVFRNALHALRDMRIAEGGSMKEELTRIARDVEGLLSIVVRESFNHRERVRNRLVERLRELAAGVPLDDNRVLQEALFLADRADITEEIARLQSHIRQFHAILDEGGTVGRKLDFLLQEFFREVNTIGSKTDEAGVVSTVVEMKNDIEKLRELVQNIQ